MSHETARLVLEYLKMAKLYGPPMAYANTTIDDAIVATEAELVQPGDDPAPRLRTEIIADLVEQRKMNFDQAAEITRLRGEAGVLKRLLAEALEPLNIALLEADDTDEEALIAALVRKIAAALKGAA